MRGFGRWTWAWLAGGVACVAAGAAGGGEPGRRSEATVAAAPAPGGPARLSVGPGLVKVRPDLPLPPGFATGRLKLRLARGECEAGQLVVSATGAKLSRVTVAARPLTKAAPADAGPPPTLSLSRVGFLRITTPSNTEGAVGEWPDPLIPTVDPIAGEPRDAFPIDVAKGRHQPVWVEACALVSAKPGGWTGSLVVTAAGGALGEVPVEVVVEAAQLPATSSLVTTFGLSGRSLLFGHHGEKLGDDERLRLVHRYARLALGHRLSLHAMSIIPPPTAVRDGRLTVDFSSWDAEIGPYLDGTALPSGARFTATDLRTPSDLPPDRHGEYLRAVEAHFREKGWLDRLFAYVMDEPKPEQLPELRRRLAAMKPARGIRRLVTTALEPGLAGQVDIWTPNLNCLVVRERDGELCARHVPRPAYRPREARGDRLWWYLSCSSHGCGQGPFGRADLDRYFAGWPSYVVDTDAVAARVMGWLAFAEGVGGELHFDMVYAYNFRKKGKPDSRDPWDDQWAFGGNGDGTLLYPGRPDRIGGRTHVPVESIRLKQIRDGLEEYELLRLLAARGPGGEARAQALARSLAPRVDRFSRDPSAWLTAREALLDALAEPPRAERR